MMSLSKSPFPVQSRFDVSGTIGGLVLTSPSGQPIPVKNLSENIEVEVGVLSEARWHLVFFFNLIRTQSWLVMKAMAKEVNHSKPSLPYLKHVI
jgi:hypothetical protein